MVWYSRMMRQKIEKGERLPKRIADKPNDAEAAQEFQKLQVAYEVLKAAEERREWKG